MKRLFIVAQLLFVSVAFSYAQSAKLSDLSAPNSIFLRSVKGYGGGYNWKIKKVSDVKADGSQVSLTGFNDQNWYPAIIPGTVLNTLVASKVYPEPYYGDNNKQSNHLIPDIAETGREFYHYWFRTAFSIPSSFKGKRVWLKLHGINYRSNIWLNGKNLGKMAGMFNAQAFDITNVAILKGNNILAVDVHPVDVPGSKGLPKQQRNGAAGENKNGGDGEIGRNVSMLMSAGWDFTAPDGIRDRNTGIWRDVEVYATDEVVLEHPFVETKLPLPDTSFSRQIISVEVYNASAKTQKGILYGCIKEAAVNFQTTITLKAGDRKTIKFTPEQYHQLILRKPKLWWPVNKGRQNLYTLQLNFVINKAISHTISTRFGIREITSDQNTPDLSRRFLVNGYPVFIRGTNWVPEAMLRNSEKRTYAELRYTRQSGLNFIRLWGGGIAESDYFYRLCDEMGIMVWTEFWITGDTRFPTDTALYFKNMTSTVKRLRNHASLAYYVSANEATEIKGAGKLIHSLDSTRGYQVQSECCGVHDGSPYKYENPMQYFENTASPRGSRVDGFNPEYGTPILPTIESLKEIMPAKDLWPINDSVWNYMDGGGFHQITTKYRQAVNQFGQSASIEEFAKKAQFVGAMNYRAIWEVWNYNKFSFGDRFASGFLFWYHNSPLPQTSARMYDWSLEPTAALYYSQNGLQPLHAQFDYLKNTVSVYNDFRSEYNAYKVEAQVYNIDAKQVWSSKTTVNIPADGLVKDAITVKFPADISPVHFIVLKLTDSKKRLISSSFYWRSNNEYKGAWTITGPAIGGFETINKLPKVKLGFENTAKVLNNKVFITTTVSNPSSSLSFFTQVKLLYSNGKSVKPAYYSDNFFSLLPGEKKIVTIEVLQEDLAGKVLQIGLDGWNAISSVTTVNFGKKSR